MTIVTRLTSIWRWDSLDEAVIAQSESNFQFLWLTYVNWKFQGDPITFNVKVEYTNAYNASYNSEGTKKMYVYGIRNEKGI